MTDANPSGIPDQASGATESKDLVSYDSYAKVLNEKKSMQSKLAEKEAILEQISQEKLQAEGKWKELAEANKKQADEFKNKNLQIVRNITTKTIKSQFKSMSEKLGCVDPELAFTACTFDDIEVNDDFEFETVKLEAKIQELTKTKPHLFKKDFKLPGNLVPSNGVATSKPLSDLSETDLKQLLKNAK
jgi:hypothetical protein